MERAEGDDGLHGLPVEAGAGQREVARLRRHRLLLPTNATERQCALTAERVRVLAMPCELRGSASAALDEAILALSAEEQQQVHRAERAAQRARFQSEQGGKWRRLRLPHMREVTKVFVTPGFAVMVVAVVAIWW